MAIFARPTGTRPGPTLMDRVLPNPIRNRVRYGFFFKKKTKAGPGFIKKSETRPKTWLGYNPVTLKLQKNPLYIQLVPHLFNHSSRLPYSASPSQKHTHRSTLKLSFSLSQSQLPLPSSHHYHSLTHPHGRRPPQALTLTHPHGLTLTWPLLLHAFPCPPRHRCQANIPPSLICHCSP